MLGSGRHFYHVTYIDDLCEGFRLCATVPRRRGPHVHPGGRRGHDARGLVAIAAEVARVPPPSRRLPVWPVWLAGAACEAIFTPLGMSPPLYRRRVDFFRKSRAFDISRARQELGFEPEGDAARGHRTHAGVVP